MRESVELKETGASESRHRYAPYEPEVTQLVLLIQAGKDEKNNKEKLAEKLKPFIENTAKRAMYVNYLKEDIEDAIGEMLKTHILGDKNGWYGDNKHHYIPYVYKFKQEYDSKYFNDSENCFCGYLRAVLTIQFQTWYRKMPGVIPVEKKEFNEKTGKMEKKIRYISSHISMDEINSDDEGNVYETNEISNIAAIEAAERERMKALRQSAIEAVVKEFVLIYIDFFDHVNSLDESSTKQRTIHERGILAYHMIFAIERLPSAESVIGKNNKPCNYYEEQLLKRPTSFRELAIIKWSESLREVLAYQNSDYQLVLRTDTEIDFLNKLRNRIDRKGISDESFLSLPSDIKNKAYGWVKTIENRVKDEYAAIPGKLKEARRKIGNGIV